MQIPTKTCPTCGDMFFTQVGLDEHTRLGQHYRFTGHLHPPRKAEEPAGRPRNAAPSPTPTPVPSAPERGYRMSEAALARMRHVGRTVAAIRRRCNDCQRVLGCGGMGLHQKASGHTGWTEVP